AGTVNGARRALSEEQGKRVGRLSAEGGPCDLPAGTPLLNGTLLDDSLSAQVRLCLIAAECGPSQETALAVLLVTRTLTGGVHTKAGCAKDVHALVLRRPGAPMAMTPPPFNVRLAKTPAPKSPRAPPSSLNYIAASEKLPTAQVGEIPGRPVGESQHPNYDPRDARNAATPKGEADRMMRDGAALLQEGRFERGRELFRGVAA